MTTLHIRQDPPQDRNYPIRLTLKGAGPHDLTAKATIQFALTEQEQDDLRRYLEDYLERAESVEPITVQQVEAMMKTRGEELYAKVLTANGGTQALWFSIRNELADLRVEIATGVAEAASIPWELMRDPKMDSPISLRVKSFVRVQSDPNISFVSVPPAQGGRVRLLYVVCRPNGRNDVELRAVANRLLQDLGEDRPRFDIKALRPPTFEQLEKELTDAKAAGRPYHIVHFDGHGIYADLSKTTLADWLSTLSALTLGGKNSGKHGYLLFEHAGAEKIRPVDGQTLGRLLHDNGVPILVLNACQSAMHEATDAPKATDGVHDEIRAIGSLAQSVVDQGIPGVLGMRYKVYVVTAAQYIGRLYAALAKGRGFGQAATEGRKYLQLHPDRWVGLGPRPLQDWFVPVVYEAGRVELFPGGKPTELSDAPELDPVQQSTALLRYVPEEGFVGRDETLLALDRAFDSHRVVLLHAYAGQGKSTTAVEFARWYAVTGGLGEQPIVLLTSFERHTDLDDLLSQIGRPFAPLLESKGIDWSAVNDADERRKLVLGILRAFPVLWIWDNVEPVAGFPEGVESDWTPAEQSDLCDFLHQLKLDAAGKAKILLTSRRDEKKWLGGIPHRIAMPRMRDSDAAKLALTLGDQKKLERSQIMHWSPLLDYCSGNPLTLRVLVGQAVKESLRGRPQIEKFVEGIRSGEKEIEDTDEEQGRDKSLGASLDYGFSHAFEDDELPIIALLHLFQGTVNVAALGFMGEAAEHALPELKGKSKEHLTGLLERAKETGLLTQIGPAYFTIHPALPWFLRQLFARHYDGKAARSTCRAALHAWVEAVGALGTYYHGRFNEGDQRVINLLELEEANLLHARRLARRNQWWSSVLACMQGLNGLYGYQGRTAEWARLVEEIVPDYCTDDDAPISGCENSYSMVMGYRVELAKNHERKLRKAAGLQKKRVEWNHRLAAAALTLPEDAPLDDHQRHLLRTMAISVEVLGQIRRDEEKADCEQYFKEAIRIYQRIRNKMGEAVARLNLGHAYKGLPAIRDLDAAEEAYRRSLDLRAPNDALGRAKCIKQIGMVHHQRFLDARECKEPVEKLLGHAQAAEEHYLKGLQLCPPDALTDLAPQHHQLGNLYSEVGELDNARDHFEQAARYSEKAGDRFGAGQTRYNIALMYARASAPKELPPQQRESLLRARVYAEAALLDFRQFEGRAAEEEAKAHALLDEIERDLGRPLVPDRNETDDGEDTKS